MESAELARSHGLLDYDASHTSNTSESEQGEPSFTFDTVSCNDVHKVIMAMPSSKAPGYDRVPIICHQRLFTSSYQHQLA